jgi:DNA-binding NarL/FixJ family response regulator
VDDHGLIRDGLQSLLGRDAAFQVVGTAPSADEGVSKAIQHAPDLILMDIDMPGMSCFDAIRIIRSRVPATKFILFSAHINDTHIQDAIDAKVEGFLDKSDGYQMIAQAIRQVHAGATCFAPTILERLVFSEHGVRLEKPCDTKLSLLSPRERELLRILARGEALKDAAKALKISYKTADKQKTSLMAKLGIHDRVELAHFAIREGLVRA